MSLGTQSKSIANSYWAPRAALVGVAFIYSLFSIITRWQSVELTDLQQMYLRTALGCLFLVLISGRRVRWSGMLKLPGKLKFKLLLQAILMYPLGVLLFIKALLLAPIANVAFLSSIPFEAVWGITLSKDPLRRGILFLIALCFLGSMLVSLDGQSLVFQFGRGEVYALISSACFSLGVYMRRLIPEEAVNNRELSVSAMILGVLIVFAMSMLKAEALPHQMSAFGVTVLVLSGFLIALNYLLVNYGYSKVTGSEAAKIFCLEAPFAVFLAAVVFSEFPGRFAIIGGTIIIMANLAMHKRDTG